MIQLSITLLTIFGGISVVGVVVAWLSDILGDLLSQQPDLRETKTNVIVLPFEAAPLEAAQTTEQEYTYPQAA